MASSHHGFPPVGLAGAPPGESVDYYTFFDRSIPTRDSYLLYGFNWTIESRLLRQEIFGILNRLHHLNNDWRGESAIGTKSQDLTTSIEMSSL